jgi:hypothetical protein
MRFGGAGWLGGEQQINLFSNAIFTAQDENTSLVISDPFMTPS